MNSKQALQQIRNAPTFEAAQKISLAWWWGPSQADDSDEDMDAMIQALNEKKQAC